MDSNTELHIKRQASIGILEINKPAIYNAFDDKLIAALNAGLNQFAQDPLIDVVCLQAAGKHFSAGADLNWMQQMAQASVQANYQDARAFAHCLYTLFNYPKPTLCVVQGHTFGGGLGLIACCDIAIAADNAQFCFSEVSLGLIPAVITPFILQTIGLRQAKKLYLTTKIFNAQEAKVMDLITDICSKDILYETAYQMAQMISQQPKEALHAAKQFILQQNKAAITTQTLDDCARALAQIRTSPEAQANLQAFLNRTNKS